MTTQSRSLKNTRPDYDNHFKRILESGSNESNPLFTEYRLLHDEYCALKRRFDLLNKEKHNLQTQMTEMNRSLELSTRIDPMTGLANRRDIMEKIEREFSRSKRHQRTFSIMLVDLDNFKAINDTHGYNHGDDVLVEVALVLRGCVRNEDVCARWGGEEFLFLLTETTLDGSVTLAKKVLEAISMTEFKAQHPGIRITASIGLCAHLPGQSLQICISRADQALQQAKQEGKNRLVVAA
ncbi:MAG: diguanylate cyclase [Desulfuromonadales bacterium]